MTAGVLVWAEVFWYGVLTAVSPCLMATTVAAITFIARRVDKPKYVLASGLFYMGGQAAAYVVMSALLVTSLLSAPVVSSWLHTYLLNFMGPILILTGMFLLELLSVQFGRGRLKEIAQKRAETGGMWAAALLGILFAMSFCPTTAALFFGRLVPRALEFESPVFLPLVYSAGVAVPVLVFALLLALAANKVAKVFEQVGRVERWARYATGTVFLLVGVYFTLAYTIGVI